MSLVVRKYDASQRRQTKRERFIYEPIRDLQDIFQFRYALKFLVGTKLRVLYQRSFLGFLWVLLNPLLNLTVTALVFSVLMNRPLKTFTIYLFSGLIPWQFFRSTLKQGSRSMISNQGLIRKILVPKLIFPLADLGNNLVNMVFSMVAMFLLLQFIGASIHPQLVLLPIAMLFFMGFTFGITLILMVLMTYYRDIQHIIDVVLRLGYFLSPILWEPQRFLGKNYYFDLVIYFNPMTYLLAPFQAIFRFGIWPPMETWMMAACWGLLTPIVGYFTYKKYEHKLIFQI